MDIPSLYETRGIKNDGNEFDIEVKISTYSNDNKIHTLLILRDISDQKQIENSLAMITQCHKIFLRASDESDFLNKICQMITEIGEYDFSFIIYKNQDDDKNTCTKAQSSMIIDNLELGLLLKPAELSIQTKEIILIEDIEKTEFYKSFQSKTISKGVKSSISIPLIIEKKIIGTLNICSSYLNTFNNEMENLKDLTDDISYCIHTIRLKIEQKNLETQLLQAQKMETIGTLAGGIAHDFNNIMTPIMGYAELSLSKIPPGTPIYKYNEQILIGALRAKELVKQILAFSHKADIKKKPVFIGKIVKDAIQLMESIIPSSITIHKHISHTCGKVVADSSQIHQIIANLCTNSFHAMEEKGGSLIIELKKETITPANKKIHPNLKFISYAELVISDTGSGMKKETIERIFEPFYTTKPVDKGTGLGLSVVHGIVKNHDGVVTVQSEIGKGTTFRIFLPILQINKDKHQYNSTHLVNDRRRILLLDDQKETTELLQIFLNSSGYEVESFNDALNALEIFNKNPDIYSLILADINMPDMDGMEFIRETIKKREDIPAILITGFENSLTEKEKKENNIKQILFKPIVEDLLLKAIEDHILKRSYESS